MLANPEPVEGWVRPQRHRETASRGLGYPISSLIKLPQQLSEALAVVILIITETEAQKGPASQRAAASEGRSGETLPARVESWSVGLCQWHQPCVLEDEERGESPG